MRDQQANVQPAVDRVPALPGSFHQEVICSNKDCAIFYKRKKTQIDLQAATDALDKLHGDFEFEAFLERSGKCGEGKGDMNDFVDLQMDNGYILKLLSLGGGIKIHGNVRLVGDPAAMELVPEHGITGRSLTLDAVVDVVRLDVVNAGDNDVVASVVQTGEDTSSQDEEGDSVYVAWDDVNSQQMQIFAHDKLERIHIDSVQIPSGWRLLLVVMLVNIPVDATYVQDTMKPHIEEVVEGVKPTNAPNVFPSVISSCAHLIVGVL